jgi:hypothetical protein
MALHRRLRKATRHGIDQRLEALAVTDRCFESSWERLTYRVFKGRQTRKDGRNLARGTTRQRIAVDFELRRVCDRDVLFVILRPEWK